MSAKLRKSLAWSTIDGVGRLLVLLIGTFLLSRLLTPQELGLGALVMIIASMASIFVGASFEEPLAQCKALRREHIATAQAFSWAVGVLMSFASVPLGLWLSTYYSQPEIAWMLPVSFVSVLLTGQSDIMVGYARRRRRFDSISIANLLGHTVGVAVAVAIALSGHGIWALVGQRTATFAVRALVLHWSLGVWVWPRWHGAEFNALSRFARITFFDRCFDTLNHLAFNTVVAAIYGLAALGYVNMALRLIEPIRALVAVAAHNLAFSHFSEGQRDGALYVERLETTSTQTSLLTVPIFAGLAVVTPILLPLFAGPGWEPAIPIAIFLALGSAIAVPARIIFSALSAQARPEYSLYSNFAGVAVTTAVLFMCSGFGPTSVGVARMAGDAMQALVGIVVTPRGFAWGRFARWQMLATAWLISGGMALLTTILQAGIPEFHAIIRLTIVIAAGSLIYVSLVSSLAPQQLSALLGRFGQRSE